MRSGKRGSSVTGTPARGAALAGLLALFVLGPAGAALASGGYLFAGTDQEEFEGRPDDRLGRFETDGAAIVGGGIIALAVPVNGMGAADGCLVTGQPFATTLLRMDYDGRNVTTALPGAVDQCCHEDFAFDGRTAGSETLYHGKYMDRIEEHPWPALTPVLLHPQDQVVGMTLAAGEIWISKWIPRQVGVWDPVGGTFSARFSTPENAGGLAYDPVHDILWVGQMGGSVVPYDRATGTPINAGFQPFGPTDLETVDGLEWVQRVDFDLKPTSCPNPFQIGSRGVLPAAVLGTDELDVREVDLSTVRLQVEGCDNGIAPLRTGYEDVTRPVEDRMDPCDCTTEGGDGYLDLTLKFDRSEVAAALSSASDRELRSLRITGRLLDGTEFTGSDCLRIQTRHGGGRREGPR